MTAVEVAATKITILDGESTEEEQRAYLELLLLLLHKSDTTKTHQVGRHHVRKDVREAEGGHLLMVTTRGSTELLQALELSLGLCEVGGDPLVLKATDTTV